MDVFARTVRPAAADAGVPLATVGRHLPILRRCVEADDPAVLVTRCLRPDQPASGDFLLLLTQRRLVVTRETRVLRRLRLHLNADLRHLSNVTWSPDERQSTVELSATAVDGIRERFLVRPADPDRIWQVDALLKHVFQVLAAQRRPASAEKRPDRRAQTRGVEPVPAGVVLG